MFNKKGFTLIELLAVIVILAIIALISSPIVIGLIENARKESFKNTAYGIIDSGVHTYAKELLKSENIESMFFTYNDGVETPSLAGKKLNYNGTKPKSGTVVVNDDGKIAIAIHNGNWCVEKDYDETEVTLTDKVIDECYIPTLYVDVSGASTPVLSDGMIPIKWDGTKWIKADLNQEWYDYNAKEWANVVLVNDATRSAYQSAAAGTEILEANVLAYLVWIPRYRYKLFNVEAAAKPVQTVEIEFEDKTTTKSNGSTNGTWLTHPSFTFGGEELNGFWVGKFETTGNGTTPTIKPGISSLRDQETNDQFATSQKFSNTATYGLNTDNDSHLMKNTEWGAVAYLTMSIYGKNDEVWSNPSTNFYTGCAGNSVSANNMSGCPNTYTTTNGQQASTTGNLYGIYDMSGGADEHVMAAMYNIDNTTIIIEDSGFTQETIDSPAMAKYIDKYTYGEYQHDQESFNRRILGDATGETRGWYGDYCGIVNDGYAWFVRSSTHSSPYSLFYSAVNANAVGSSHPYDTFRVTILGSNS